MRSRSSYPNTRVVVAFTVAAIGLLVLLGLALWEVWSDPSQVRKVLSALALTLFIASVGGIAAWKVQRWAAEAAFPGYDANARRFGLISAFCRGWSGVPSLSRIVDRASSHLLITGMSLRDTLAHRMEKLEAALERGVSVKLLLLSEDAYRAAAERHPAAEQARIGDVDQALKLIDVLCAACAARAYRGKLEVCITDHVPYFTAALTDIAIECSTGGAAPIPSRAALRVQPRISDVEQIHGPVLVLDPRGAGAELFLRGINAMWCRAKVHCRVG